MSFNDYTNSLWDTQCNDFSNFITHQVDLKIKSHHFISKTEPNYPLSYNSLL